jgi:sialate O-acetylesterase
LIRVAQVCHRNPHLSTEIREEPVSYWGNVKWESTTFLAPRSNTADIPGCGSAVNYFFARALQQNLGTNIPIGMIEVGAIMTGESWISYEEVAATPELAVLRGKPYPNATSRCFGANIAPLVPYALRGFAYYQGEMNAGRGEQYRDVLPALIRSWRKAWKNDNLPFLIVQLPGFNKDKPRERVELDMPEEILKQLQKDSVEHGFVGVREAQLMTRLSMPRTGLAVIMDLGDPYDIHPGRKRAVGERLALLARQLSYGEKDLVAEGPLATGAEFNGNAAKVSFLNVGGGLVAPSGRLNSFELAGEDGKWVEAEAAVEGSAVVVKAPGLAAPEAMRYAWAGYPQISLFNKEGLPASPFRFPVPSTALKVGK